MSKSSPLVITNARTAASREMASREKRYAITMAIRTACFVAMIFVSGPMRWVLLAGAIFLPYIAVILANQANTKVQDDGPLHQADAVDAPQLTQGPPSPEIISGELVEDDSDVQRPQTYVPHDRVA